MLLEWTGSGDGRRLQVVEGFRKTCEGGYPHKVSMSEYLELSLTPMLIVNLTATSFHRQCCQSMQRWTHTVFLNITMTMATKAQHAHTNMPSNNQVSDWKSHATVSTMFFSTQVFTDKKVFNFILLLNTINWNDMREDEQGNYNADMQT